MGKRPLIIHGNEAIEVASDIIAELAGVNGFDVPHWIEYEEVNIMDKCFKPHKKTILHDYIGASYSFSIYYLLDKHFPMAVINQLKELFDFYKIDYSSLGEFKFWGYDDENVCDEEGVIEEYADKMYEFFMKNLFGIVVDDVFTILYNDKNFLFDFNTQIASIIRTLKITDYPEYLKEDGVMKRCDYFLSWLKRGVFYRDKGRCQICGTDLTKILNLDNQENYDHIIPLQSGGSNDPTNIQLTCEHCNKAKGARDCRFNNMASPFWELDSYDYEAN